MPFASDTPFSTTLRKATEAEHGAAESSEFITTLMAGDRSARDYTLLIAQYAHLYRALEDEVANLRGLPEVADFFDPALERSEQLSRDLRFLLPMHGMSRCPEPLPATARYVAAIRAAAAEPARLVAHHYLRYLGDLSGGLAIGRLVARHYEIPPEALNMWRFDSIAKPKVYKDAYRRKLDAFGAQPQCAAALLDEARRGFTWNKAIFEDLLFDSKARDAGAAYPRGFIPESVHRPGRAPTRRP
ncbi:biliverdin-producing heme oxygenase [Glutamicibacter sp. X7]